MPLYHHRTYRLPVALEEELTAGLWAAGTLGLETRSGPGGLVEIVAWFDASEPDWVVAVTELEGRLSARGLVGLDAGELPETDWLASWREQARPFAVGERFWLDPREPGEPLTGPTPDGRIPLALPAHRAFGTGGHESTRLILELLEAFPVAGRRVLDVGTGSGVLALAALALGARRAVGYDPEAAAVFEARLNGRRNGYRPLLFAGQTASLAPGAPFDLVLVNIVPERILPEIAELTRLLAAPGALVFSGILLERGSRVVERLGVLGFEVAAERRAGEWVAYRFARPRSAAAGAR